MSSAHQAVPEQARAGAGPDWRRRSARCAPGSRSPGPGPPHAAILALARPDHGPGRARPDARAETPDRPLARLLPDEPAHRLDHPHGQPRPLRRVRARRGLGLRALPRLGTRWVIGPLVFLATLTVLLSFRWLHLLACPLIALLTRDRSDEANRRASSRGLASGGAELAGPGAGRHRPDRVLDRRAPAGRSGAGTIAPRPAGMAGTPRTSCWSCSTRCGPTISASMAMAATRPPISRGSPGGASRSSRLDRRPPGRSRRTPA